MKKQIAILLVMLSAPYTILTACPTCIGRNQTQSPPFFTQDFYPPEKDGLDELYEEYIEQPQTETMSTSTTSHKSTQPALPQSNSLKEKESQ